MFRRAFASALTLDVASRGVSGITALLLLRELSIEQFAFIVLFLAVGQFIGASATAGVRMRYLRTEAERFSRRSKAHSEFAGALIAQSLLAVAATGAILAVTTLANLGDRGSDTAALAGLAGLYAVGMAMTELAIFHQQAHLRFVRGGSIAVARSLLLLAVACLTLVGVTSGPTIALLSAVCLTALGVVICVPILRGAGIGRLRGSNMFSGESGWLTLYYVASGGYATIDVLIIAALLPKTDVASFGAAQRYYAIVLGALPALVAVLRVRTSQADMVDSSRAQRDMLLRWIRTTGPALGVGVGVLAAVAPLLLPVANGGRYQDSIPVFQVLMIGAFSMYVLTPGPNILMSQRRYRLLALILTFGLVGNALGDVLVARSFGIIAVASVATAVEVVLAVVIVAAAMRPPRTGKIRLHDIPRTAENRLQDNHRVGEIRLRDIPRTGDFRPHDPATLPAPDPVKSN